MRFNKNDKLIINIMQDINKNKNIDCDNNLFYLVPSNGWCRDDMLNMEINIITKCIENNFNIDIIMDLSLSKYFNLLNKLALNKKVNIQYIDIMFNDDRYITPSKISNITWSNKNDSLRLHENAYNIIKEVFNKNNKVNKVRA